jgi:hypothetical protein
VWEFCVVFLATTKLYIVAQKQPQTICKQMSVAVFQLNFIYNNRAVVCQPPTLRNSIKKQKHRMRKEEGKVTDEAGKVGKIISNGLAHHVKELGMPPLRL